MCKQILKGEEAQTFLSLFENDKYLQMVARLRFVEGLTVPEIADRMHYCEKTIHRHIRKIKQIASLESGWKASVMNTFCGGRC